MSIQSVNQSKATVLDLIPVQPKAEARDVSPRTDPFEQDGPRGFNDYLREAKPSNDSEPTEPRGKSEPVEQAGASEFAGERGGGEAKASEENKSEQAEPGDAKAEAAQDSAKPADDQTQQDADAGDQALQAELSESQQQRAQAVASQLAVTQDVLGGQQSTQQSAEAGKQAEGLGAQQAQAALTQAAAESAAKVQAQVNAAQAQSAVAGANQSTTQLTAEAQTNTGDTAGEAKAGGQASTAAVLSNAANATAAANFALPEQGASEARLPLNSGANLQQVDSAKPVQAQPIAPNSDSDSLNTARLTRGLANAVQQRGGAVTLRLTPPEMGTVRIQMQITGTNVSASFHAESASAQTLLTQQLAQLRTSLETQGMNVERLSVQPLASTTSSQNANQSNNQDAQQQNTGQQQSANDGRSRGQYSGDNANGRASDQQDTGSEKRQAPQGFFDQLHDVAEQAA